MRLLIDESKKVPPGRGHPSRYRHLITFLLHTGLRISEAPGATVLAFDRKEKILHVRQQLVYKTDSEWGLEEPKTKASIRTIALTPEAFEAITNQLAMVEGDKRRAGPAYRDNGLLFATERGTPGTARNIQRQLDAMLERADVPHCGLHDLRRTCLTNLANRGFPLHQLQRYAGHSSITTTAKYYVKVNLDAQRAALADLKPLPLARDKKVVRLVRTS
jgi:integrase